MDEATQVWNRATTDAALDQPGDQALHDALVVDGQIKNAGLLSALDYIDYDQIERGAAGFEYLGIADAAAALRSALPRSVLERIEGELEDAYDGAAEALDEAFARTYRDRPGDFAPV